MLNAACLIAGLGVSILLADESSVQKEFVSPPDFAKPHTWWHWMNGYVSAEGITKDLEAMERVGIGGFQMFQIEFRMDPGPVKYLSKEWRELMKHTLQEADRLGLEVCYHQTAGWSSSGGPWITPEFAMQNIVWTERRVSGLESVDIEFARPKDLRDDYFQEIAVLAFPTPESELNGIDGFRLDNLKSKPGNMDDFAVADFVDIPMGEVQVIAEVTLNGWNLGILWKPPFRLDLPDGMLKTRGNQLEVHVTNLWVNRLIGDERHPPTDSYIADAKPGAALIKAIEYWLKTGQPRPATDRGSFSTCKFYEKDSPLLESGLLGPVHLHFGVETPLNQRQ